MCFNTPEYYQVRRNAGTGTPAWQKEDRGFIPRSFNYAKKLQIFNLRLFYIFRMIVYGGGEKSAENNSRKNAEVR